MQFYTKLVDKSTTFATNTDKKKIPLCAMSGNDDAWFRTHADSFQTAVNDPCVCSVCRWIWLGRRGKRCFVFVHGYIVVHIDFEFGHLPARTMYPLNIYDI